MTNKQETRDILRGLAGARNIGWDNLLQAIKELKLGGFDLQNFGSFSSEADGGGTARVFRSLILKKYYSTTKINLKNLYADRLNYSLYKNRARLLKSMGDVNINAAYFLYLDTNSGELLYAPLSKRRHLLYLGNPLEKHN